MSTVTHDIVQKLWNLCNVLKDDGVTFHQYVTELTYILFLKMAKETDQEEKLVLHKPNKEKKGIAVVPGTRWDDLMATNAMDRLQVYEDALRDYRRWGTAEVQQIYVAAATFIKKPATLSTLVAEIDKLDWYVSVRRSEPLAGFRPPRGSTKLPPCARGRVGMSGQRSSGRSSARGSRTWSSVPSEDWRCGVSAVGCIG